MSGTGRCHSAGVTSTWMVGETRGVNATAQKGQVKERAREEQKEKLSAGT